MRIDLEMWLPDMIDAMLKRLTSDLDLFTLTDLRGLLTQIRDTLYPSIAPIEIDHYPTTLSSGSMIFRLEAARKLLSDYPNIPIYDHHIFQLCSLLNEIRADWLMYYAQTNPAG